MKRTKIFVSAYACEPGLGSEIGVGWHWILELSKFFELWVLTRSSNRASIEAWFDEHPEFREKIHFIYFDLPHWARFWKRGLRGVRTYYQIWTFLADRLVKKTMQSNGISLFHHLTYGNALWRVSSYGMTQQFIWGPVGGVETIPASFSKYYGFKQRVLEMGRRLIVALLPLNCSFKKRCQHAKLILCKTEETRRKIPSEYREKAVLCTDVAVDRLPDSLNSIDGCGNTDVHLLCVGRLDAWRGFDLAIEAMAQVKESFPNTKLTILGEGDDRRRLEKLIEKRELRHHVFLLGKVSMEEYRKHMKSCSAVLNPCLKEGAVTVSFDALSYGKPLICIDTGGYTRYFKDSYSIVIPQDDRAAIIRNLAQGITSMTDSAKRSQLGEAALKAGQQFTWEARGREIYQLLEAGLKL